MLLARSVEYYVSILLFLRGNIAKKQTVLKILREKLKTSISAYEDKSYFKAFFLSSDGNFEAQNKLYLIYAIVSFGTVSKFFLNNFIRLSYSIFKKQFSLNF